MKYVLAIDQAIDLHYMLQWSSTLPEVDFV